MTVPDRADRARLVQLAQAERAALAQRLQAMPQAMRALRQWLVWKLVNKPGAVKPAKVPFYANGKPRGWPHGKPRDGLPTDKQPQVDQGHELDRAHLVSLDEALAAFARSPDWAGVGFAFLPGDGLIGVDIDGAVDRETGEVSELCTKLLGLCGSYAERSVSGTGVHIILAGDVEGFKDDAIGLEVYARRQYFTCTGLHWGGTPDQAMPADDSVLAYMRELVDESKAQQRQAKEAARAAVAAPAPPPRAPSPAAPGAGQQVNDFKRVNEAALASLDVWVLRVLPAAQRWTTGYRITSKALGRELQEDLQLLPSGIWDYGEEQGMSPIDVVLKWQPGMASAKDAMLWLAQALGMQLAPRRPAGPPRPPPLGAPAAPAPPPPPPPGGPADDGSGAPLADAPAPESGPLGDDPPPADPEASTASNVVQLPKPKGRARAPKPGKGDDPPADAGDGEPVPVKRGKVPAETWELVDVLCQRFALIYSTDAAWDCAELMIVKISAMRLAFGKLAVNLWLSRPAPVRRMIRPADLVFEPGQQVPPPQINMFAGLDLEPTACGDADAQPMLALLRHLCSESETAGDDVDAVMHWVLCWMALPLQRLGTKMATACVFHGAQGTGKNLFWDVWRDLFGVYGVTVGQTELEDKFNGWVSRKLAILGDEVVSRQEMYHNKNRLKLLVTQQDKFPIRGMQMETRWESNHANVVFLSNDSQPLALEERDRRYMVIYTPLEADAEVYEAVRDFKAQGGAAKWLHFLMHYPLDDFTAHTKPLMTQAKEDLIEAAWKPASRFAHEWLEGFIDLPVRVCSNEQLYRAFKRWCDMTGAKWPPEQSVFTNEVKRWVNERVKRGTDGVRELPRLAYKQIGLKDPSGARRTVRCWLPRGTGPVNGVSEGEWACDAVATFEQDLHRFCRRPGGLEDDK